MTMIVEGKKVIDNRKLLGSLSCDASSDEDMAPREGFLSRTLDWPYYVFWPVLIGVTFVSLVAVHAIFGDPIKACNDRGGIYAHSKCQFAKPQQR